MNNNEKELLIYHLENVSSDVRYFLSYLKNNDKICKSTCISHMINIKNDTNKIDELLRYILYIETKENEHAI